MKKLLFVALVLVIGCSKDDPAPLAVADFTFSDDAKFAPLKIQFQAQTENAIKVEWDFGDGNTSTDPNPSHIYTKGGTYQVRLDVFNSEDKKDTKTKSLVVLNAPTKFRIDKITVTSIPFDNNGSNWDLLDGPDVYLTVGAFSTTIYYDNVLTNSLPLVFGADAGFPQSIVKTNFDNIFEVGIYDYDDVPPDQFMGSYSFKVSDQIPNDGGDYPTQLLFDQKTKFKFKMEITWLE